MKKLLKKLLGIKGIEAWAIIGEDFLLIQRHATMDCQVYIDSRGKTALRENLKIVPCTIIYQPPNSAASSSSKQNPSSPPNV